MSRLLVAPIVLSILLMAGKCASNETIESTESPSGRQVSSSQTESSSEGQDSAEGSDRAGGDIQPLEAIERYGGHIRMPFESIVVRDQETYDELVDHLPEHEVVKGVDPPPSDDPLLQQPAVDFDERMLVVATCPTYYCKIEMVGMRIEGDERHIVVRLPGEGKEAEYAARPLAIGRYKAAKVPRVEGTVRFKFRGPGQRTRDTDIDVPGDE